MVSGSCLVMQPNLFLVRRELKSNIAVKWLDEITEADHESEL